MAKPGIVESALSIGSGLRNSWITGLLFEDDDYIAVETDIGAAAGADFDYGSGGANAITLINQRLPCPSTLVVYVNQTDTAGGNTPAAGTLSLRIDGFDQFGNYQRETTPFATVHSNPRTYIYTSKVFSVITGIEIAGTGIDSANVVDLHIGTRPQFTADTGNSATVTAADWTNATSTLTEVGAFASYTFSAGDEIFIQGGTGVNPGLYSISSKTDDDNIVLGSSITGGANVVDSTVVSDDINKHVAITNHGYGTGMVMAERQGDLHAGFQGLSITLMDVATNTVGVVPDADVLIGQSASGWLGDPNKWAITAGNSPIPIPGTIAVRFWAYLRSLASREHPSPSNFPD